LSQQAVGLRCTPNASEWKRQGEEVLTTAGNEAISRRGTTRDGPQRWRCATLLLRSRLIKR